jgi:hypothetical protein
MGEPLMKTILQQQQQVSKGTANVYWWISLVTGGVVIAVVAFLLTILARTAEQIEAGVGQIWQVGQLIANNTVHIPLLVRTNQIVAQIHQAADGIERSTGRIERAVVDDAKK